MCTVVDLAATRKMSEKIHKNPNKSLFAWKMVRRKKSRITAPFISGFRYKATKWNKEPDPCEPSQYLVNDIYDQELPNFSRQISSNAFHLCTNKKVAQKLFRRSLKQWDNEVEFDLELLKVKYMPKDFIACGTWPDSQPALYAIPGITQICVARFRFVKDQIPKQVKKNTERKKRSRTQ